MAHIVLPTAQWQLYRALLDKRSTELQNELRKRENEAVWGLHTKHMATDIQLAATREQYDIKRAVELQRLKLEVMKEVMDSANDVLSPEQAEALRRDVIASLEDYERQMVSRLGGLRVFQLGGRGTTLRIERFFLNERNRVVQEFNVLVARAHVARERGAAHDEYDAPLELFVEDIDNFARAAEVPRASDVADIQPLKGIPETEVKQAFAEIIGEAVVPKDWGGERSDLFTASLTVRGERVSAAFIFKGPSTFRPMTHAILGKNGDQVDRLFSEPAILLVLQHCHIVKPPIRNMMRAYAESTRKPRMYCIIDGFDTLRILRAYGKCGIALA